MTKLSKITLVASTCMLAATMTLATPGISEAGKRNEATTGMKVLDATVVRPTAMIVSFIGTGLYVGTAPLTGLMGYADKSAKYLMRKPWRYTSGRPLGTPGLPPTPRQLKRRAESPPPLQA